MIVCLRYRLLSLAHRKVVAHAIYIALLRLTQRLIRQFHARSRNFHLLLRRLDIQQRIESKDLAASIAAIAKICATAKGLDLPPEIRLMLLIALEVN